jgi:hypothetical protein
MAAESGHVANRVYLAQDGSLHLNGAAVYTANELDISGTIGVRAGQVINSTTGAQDITTGLTGIVGASANVLSTAVPSTVAGIAHAASVSFSTASGTLTLTAWKPTSSAIPQAMAATSTASVLAWTAIGF